MKKLVYINFRVGSGIEYCGNIFSSWLKDVENIYFFEIKDQSTEQYITDSLIGLCPDIIIMNEVFRDAMHSVFYYKKYNPETKIILLNHCWQNLIADPQQFNNDYEKVDRIFAERFFKTSCDVILNLNCMPNSILLPEEISKVTVSKYFPIENFRVETSWEKRENMFLYLGTIIPLKLSEKFIDNIAGTGLKIDVYGDFSRWSDVSYIKKVKDSKELIYKGEARQSDVSSILNKYKYFVMAHDGAEPFNLTLLQSILCGTIPIVSNDRNSVSYDYTWIDWAKGMYFGCNNELDLISNLCKIKSDNPDFSMISESISKEASEVFSYDKLKEMFLEMVRNLIRGE